MKRRLYSLLLVLFGLTPLLPASGSCTYSAACEEPNGTLCSDSTADGTAPRPTTPLSSLSGVVCQSDPPRVTTSFSLYSDADDGDNGPVLSNERDDLDQYLVSVHTAVSQPSVATPTVVYNNGQTLVAMPLGINEETVSAFASYCFTVEAMEGVGDTILLVGVALHAYKNGEYWQASLSALAALLKILKAVNLIVNFTLDMAKSNTMSQYALLSAPHSQEAHSSIAVFAPTQSTTTHFFTISTLSLVASDAYGAVIASPVRAGAGTAPTQGSNYTNYTNSTTPSYTA